MSMSTEISAWMGSLDHSMNVKRVYGEPITTEGKTLIPVARVGYGFGAGFGNKHADPAPTAEAGEGGGGGGGGTAVPLGVIEITPDTTRFVPVSLMRRNLAMVGVGLLLGGLLFPRK